MAKQKRHAVPNPHGDWDIKRPGAFDASAHLATQRNADERAAEIVHRAGGGERVTHGRDGRIRSKDMIASGNAARPPHDREH